jgi:hypothetical protein
VVVVVVVVIVVVVVVVVVVVAVWVVKRRSRSTHRGTDIRFITALTTARQLSLSWATAIQSISPNATSSVNVKTHVSHPYKTTGKIIFLYVLIFRFLNYILNWMTASIPRLQSVLNFFVNGMLICWGRFQIFELFHPFKGFITCLYEDLHVINPTRWKFQSRSGETPPSAFAGIQGTPAGEFQNRCIVQYCLEYGETLF